MWVVLQKAHLLGTLPVVTEQVNRLCVYCAVVLVSGWAKTLFCAVWLLCLSTLLKRGGCLLPWQPCDGNMLL